MKGTSLEEVQEIPKEKRSGKWVDRVEEFRMSEGEKKRVNYPDDVSRKAAYAGLKLAVKRRGYRDEMRVVQRKNEIFLVTHDYWLQEGGKE